MRAVKVNGAKRREGRSARILGDVEGRLRAALRRDSALWRRFMFAGVSHGPEAWVRYSPALIGWAFGAALHDQRRAVRNTLRLIHGRRPSVEELREVAEVFGNFASSMTEAMLVGCGRGFYATSRPVNEWYMQSSIAAGRGVIVAAAQTAGWDVGGSLLYATGNRQVMVVMERESDAAARELHDATRNREGVRVVHVGSDPLSSLPLLKHLQHGGVIALKFDRNHDGMRTVPVTLFGRPWRVPAGPLHLAALTGAAIVPCFTRRLGFLEYQPINYPPAHVPRRATATDYAEVAQYLTGCLEDFATNHPTQWIRFHED